VPPLVLLVHIVRIGVSGLARFVIFLFALVVAKRGSPAHVWSRGVGAPSRLRVSCRGLGTAPRSPWRVPKADQAHANPERRGGIVRFSARWAKAEWLSYSTTTADERTDVSWSRFGCATQPWHSYFKQETGRTPAGSPHLARVRFPPSRYFVSGTLASINAATAACNIGAGRNAAGLLQRDPRGQNRLALRRSDLAVGELRALFQLLVTAASGRLVTAMNTRFTSP
jgi:hypothetical protein